MLSRICTCSKLAVSNSISHGIWFPLKKQKIRHHRCFLREQSLFKASRTIYLSTTTPIKTFAFSFPVLAKCHLLNVCTTHMNRQEVRPEVLNAQHCKQTNFLEGSSVPSKTDVRGLTGKFPPQHRDPLVQTAWHFPKKEKACLLQQLTHICIHSQTHTHADTHILHRNEQRGGGRGWETHRDSV